MNIPADSDFAPAIVAAYDELQAHIDAMSAGQALHAANRLTYSLMRASRLARGGTPVQMVALLSLLLIRVEQAGEVKADPSGAELMQAVFLRYVRTQKACLEGEDQQ